MQCLVFHQKINKIHLKLLQTISSDPGNTVLKNQKPCAARDGVILRTHQFMKLYE
eukprot:TRINITY_DN9841_c0_g1_i1.p2 TRINITY_DN9841_c0_g1~~TRINITY_DN9841_c0_g1_i1.p2  ORF type:complete len:55 (+),score=7.56 TRINITY_DN9841_c0_g1_i1:228-392(+)